ncbi:MAG: hypothetical protein KIT22_00755 [Verrucomicrobiae bacterium]|nr:hypothetical protein [Verrucomicrobiae bacterium]
MDSRTAMAADEYFPIVIQTSASATSGRVVAYSQPSNASGYYESSFEYGLQATLDPSAPTVIRNLMIPYYSSFDLAGGLTARIYANDGPLVGQSRAPGTLLSQVVTDINGPGSTTLTIGYGFVTANTLPETITVTLSFEGIGGDRTAGWVLSTADNVVGTHPEFFWELNAANEWTRKSLTVIPEPKMSALLGMGGLIVAVLASRGGARTPGTGA